MLQLKHHKMILTLFVVINILASSVNFGNFLHHGRFVSPSNVVLYDVLRIERMHRSRRSSGFSFCMLTRYRSEKSRSAG